LLVYSSVIQFIDLGTDGKLLYDMYYYSREYPENASYKIVTTTMAISMLSTYLIAYSSIIKLMLDSGKFEPHIIK
jgi:hypothetical protein